MGILEMGRSANAAPYRATSFLVMQLLLLTMGHG
jgi:hypothetical protein